MANKVLVADIYGGNSLSDMQTALADLGAVTAGKLTVAFDWLQVLVPGDAEDPKAEAVAYVKGLQVSQPVILMLGADTRDAFGVPEYQRDAEPFEFHWQEGVHLGVWINHPVVDHETFVGFANKLPIKTLIKDLLRISAVAVTKKDAQVVIDVVNQRPDVLSFWTKKIRDEIIKNMEAGRDVEKYDLGQLMASYGNDLTFVKDEPTEEPSNE